MQLRQCSRKEAEQYIEGGWVTVNGTVVESPQSRVLHQEVKIAADASLLNVTPVTLLLNKPEAWLDGTDDDDDDTVTRTERSAKYRKGKTRDQAPRNCKTLLTAAQHTAQDASGIALLQRHLKHQEGQVPLERDASGLVVFTQDWRVERKLTEDLGTMEHELMLDVSGEVTAEMLKPIQRGFLDTRLNLPPAKISVSSSAPERSRLRLAVKGAHPGLSAYVCDLAQLELLAIRRIRIGRVSLGDVGLGEWRYVADWERF